MTKQEVASVLRRRGLPDTMTPYGFPLNEKFRLECGSGIAGRGNLWSVTHIPTGEKWKACETAKQLREHLDAIFKEPKLGVYRGRYRGKRAPK